MSVRVCVQIMRELYVHNYAYAKIFDKIVYLHNNK